LDRTVSSSRTRSLEVLAPVLFVLLWSTGYVGAKFGLPYAEPFTFLSIRLLLAMLALVLLALVLRERFPTLTQVFHAAIAGLLLHAGYLGGVFFGIKLGVPAGLSAIIVNLQPVLTSSLAARALGEHVSARQWFGLACGFVGVMFAIAEKMSGFDQVQPLGVIACIVALLSSTVGTVYQKRFGSSTPLITGTLLQYLASSIVFVIIAFTLETRVVQWTTPFVLTLAWFVGPISLGAILLLLWMIRHGSASRVSSLFYLVPPLTALEAYFLFGERLGWTAFVGLVLTMIGVALIVGRTEKPLEPA
jgi:drug/metabolite transporter (DMT)-like permease